MVLQEILREGMKYNIERNKCIQDPIYFIEYYVIVNNKNIVLKPYQKLFIKMLSKNE